MISCTSCGTSNLDSSNFCDECGARLVKPVSSAPEAAAYVPPKTDPAPFAPAISESPSRTPAQVTSIGIPPLAEPPRPSSPSLANGAVPATTMNAKLVIERGDTPGAEFTLSGTEATIGRWDADNGVFPDVDLDQHDGEAKVSRRHARIKLVSGKYMIEDLGSTNGTYINRGRRLLPGSPQVLEDNDEVIVGKTFLRFHVNG